MHSIHQPTSRTRSGKRCRERHLWRQPPYLKTAFLNFLLNESCLLNEGIEVLAAVILLVAEPPILLVQYVSMVAAQ